LNDNLLDSEFDYQFPDVDGSEHKRGGEIYRRPVGCLRYALKVLDRYDDNKWLTSKDSDWPVCYHVTQETFLPDNVDSRDGNKVYVSPDFNLALDAAEKFHFEGAEYKLFYQDRVNPANITKMVTSKGEYWIAQSGNDIRPYGICVKKV